MDGNAKREEMYQAVQSVVHGRPVMQWTAMHTEKDAPNYAVSCAWVASDAACDAMDSNTHREEVHQAMQLVVHGWPVMQLVMQWTVMHTEKDAQSYAVSCA